MINILPYNQKVLVKRIRYMRIATVVVWSAIMLLVVAGVLFVPTLNTIESRSAIATEQMARLEQSGVIAKAVDVDALEARTTILKDKLAAPPVPSPMQYIALVQHNTVSGIKITGYDMSNTDKAIMQVHGVASTRESLQQFVATLQADNAVMVVDSPVANFIKGTQSEFMITVTFKSS